MEDTNIRYAIMYPPNTKDADAEKIGKLLLVHCPHCKGTHFHQIIDRYKSYIEANCKRGFYVIRKID